MIGRLLGHADAGTTARYAHLGRDAEKRLRPPWWAAASKPTSRRCGRAPRRGQGRIPVRGRNWRRRRMARLRNRSISKRMVDALGARKDTVYWDSALNGFRGAGLSLGGQGLCGPDPGTGRAEAGRGRSARRHHHQSGTAAGGVDARPHQGGGSARLRARGAPTDADRRWPSSPSGTSANTSRFTASRERRMRTATWSNDTSCPCSAICPSVRWDRRHVSDLHYKLRNTPCAANEAVALLSRMLNRAEAWGLTPAGGNPCRHVVKYRQRRRERFLTEREFRRIGRTLAALEAAGRVPVHAAAALRLLMLTGCRCNEILALRWDDVHLDAREIRLRDSKTGPRVVALSPAAERVLGGAAARRRQSMGHRGPPGPARG